MIVRILGEGQYDVPDDDRSTLDQLDNELVTAVDRNDAAAFGVALGEVASFVRTFGHLLANDAFTPSELVVPFSDATLEETKRLLAEAVPGAGSERPIVPTTGDAP